MYRFEYWYDKSHKLTRLLFYVALILYWFVMLLFPAFSRGGTDGRGMLVLILLPVIILCFYYMIDDYLKMSSDSPAIEGDAEGLIIRGVWLKPHQLAWEEICAVTYRIEKGGFDDSSRYKHLLVFKRFENLIEISLVLNDINADVEEILADIADLAPHIEIRYEEL